MDLDIYEYDSPSDFLKDVLLYKQNRNPRFSLRAWVANLGLKDPGHFSRILRGERKIQIELVNRIADSIPLEAKERKYFEIMVLKENAQTSTEKDLFKKALAEATSLDGQSNTTHPERFELISNWFHTALRAMLNLKDFQVHPAWMAKRLRGKSSEREIKLAIEKTLSSNFTELINGRLVSTELKNLYVATTSASQTLQKAHLEFIELAKAAVKEQEISQRQVLSSTVAIRKSDYPLMKGIIEDCHHKILALACNKNSDADEVYQLCSQFFALTGDPND